MTRQTSLFNGGNSKRKRGGSKRSTSKPKAKAKSSSSSGKRSDRVQVKAHTRKRVPKSKLPKRNKDGRFRKKPGPKPKR